VVRAVTGSPTSLNGLESFPYQISNLLNYTSDEGSSDIFPIQKS
jgi:hypothetical protein